MRWKLLFSPPILLTTYLLSLSPWSLSDLVGRGRAPAVVSNWVHVLLLSCAAAITPALMQHCTAHQCEADHLAPIPLHWTGPRSVNYDILFRGWLLFCVSGRTPSCARFSTRAAPTRSSLVGHCPYLCLHLFQEFSPPPPTSARPPHHYLCPSFPSSASYSAAMSSWLHCCVPSVTFPPCPEICSHVRVQVGQCPTL